MTLAVSLLAQNTPAATGTVVLTPLQAADLHAGQASADGDHLSAHLSSASLAHSVISVSDSRNGPWTEAQIINSGETGSQWYIDNALGLTTSDSITVVFSGSSAVKNCIIARTSGAALDGAPDQVAQASGSSAAPAVSSGTLVQAAEAVIVLLTSANGGHAPALGAGWTQLAQLHAASNEYSTVAYKIVSSTSPVSFSATITSAAWSALLMSIRGYGPVVDIAEISAQTIVSTSVVEVSRAFGLTGGVTSAKVRIASIEGITASVTSPVYQPMKYMHSDGSWSDLKAKINNGTGWH